MGNLTFFDREVEDIETEWPEQAMERVLGTGTIVETTFHIDVYPPAPGFRGETKGYRFTFTLADGKKARLLFDPDDMYFEELKE